MKVEAGESLILSWLRNVRRCQIVQMNWKASGQWPVHDRARLEAFISEAGETFRHRHGVEIFNKGSPAQLLRQGEIDVLGLRRGENGALSLMAVDVANHEKGLNYGSRPQTIARVLKKLIRSAVSAEAYFPGIPAEVIFAAPTIRARLLNELRPLVDELGRLAAEVLPDTRIALICNEDVRRDILDPVLHRAGEVADTSELFLRSYQLLRTRPPRQAPTAPFPSPASPAPEPNEKTETKIGARVQARFKSLIGLGWLPPEEIGRLQDVAYARATFGQSYPILRKHDSSLSESEKQFLVGDYPRFYVDPFEISGESYYLCSQWEKRHRPAFEVWSARFAGPPPPPSASPPAAL